MLHVVGMLGITTDENWKAFAKHLGFTKHEIRNRLSSTTDPFALIMGAFQARGGWLALFFIHIYRSHFTNIPPLHVDL